MLSRLIKANDLKPAPWKNGGGMTFEVAISPPGATIAALEFDWRVSIAEVTSSGPFSQFPGFDRKLVVWKGEGLTIDGAPKMRLETFVLCASGELRIEGFYLNPGDIYQGDGRVQVKALDRSELVIAKVWR